MVSEAEPKARPVTEASSPTPHPRLLVVIVCYKAADLAIDCLSSLEPEIAALPGTHVAVCENGTGEESATQLAEAIESNGWQDWITLTVIHPNRGFAGGNNVILREAMSRENPPDYFLLLNADTIVRPGALVELLSAAETHPEAGIIGPRLEWPDGTPQISCFRDRAPTSEFFAAARTGILERMLGARSGIMEISDRPIEPEWTSFACALLRRQVLAQIGLLDEGFYLYFDDPDYCRRARNAGWRILHWPYAHVVHLRGQSNPMKERAQQRKRPPRYWYESRARYYGKYYGRTGVLAANAFWTMGRGVSFIRELLRTKEPHVCEAEWHDIWTHCWNPLRPPVTRQDD